MKRKNMNTNPPRFCLIKGEIYCPICRQSEDVTKRHGRIAGILMVIVECGKDGFVQQWSTGVI